MPSVMSLKWWIMLSMSDMASVLEGSETAGSGMLMGPSGRRAMAWCRMAMLWFISSMRTRYRS